MLSTIHERSRMHVGDPILILRLSSGPGLITVSRWFYNINLLMLRKLVKTTDDKEWYDSEVKQLTGCQGPWALFPGPQYGPQRAWLRR